MIQYSLKCTCGYTFDSWFQSASAYDALQRSGHVACGICGSQDVQKAMMAPRVRKADIKAENQVPAQQATAQNVHPLEKMRRHIEANAEYVGPRFATEARAMQLKESPERPIYGEANGAEARALLEEGVPVVPLPFLPSRKAN
jgi:hypothetical protein